MVNSSSSPVSPPSSPPSSLPTPSGLAPTTEDSKLGSTVQFSQIQTGANIVADTLLTGLTSSYQVVKNLHTYVFARSDAERQEAAASLPPQLLWTTKITLAGAISGFVSGAYIGGSRRGLQFLAENAHRLPRTVGGWYQYHRHKQHEMIHAAMMSGFKYGARFGVISATFCTVEQVAEWGRGGIEKEGYPNTALAGFATAALFSMTAGLSFQYAKYALLFGGASGLGIGLLQDAYGLSYGYSLRYPDLPRRTWSDLDFSAWFSTRPMMEWFSSLKDNGESSPSSTKTS
ncbi:hypothetical protein HK102_005469 [Quaeritorhiza haematococci]|nr:hypothetical protein HK102_005469 [Quaeritorhiza haematococci]